MNLATSSWFLPFAGLAAGACMGFAARWQHFCTMGALERHWHADDSSGVRTWVLAAAVAMIATQTLIFAGLVDPAESFYLAPNLVWTGAIIGGLAFGFGMALVGTCGFGALVRLGGGSLRSLVVLAVLALSALSAQRGLIAQVRVAVADNLAADLSFAGDQSIGSILTALTGTDMHVAVAVLTALAMLAWIFSDRTYRARLGSIAAGSVIGLMVAFGWFATNMAMNQSFDAVQVESASFVLPVGDTLLQLITYTGVLPDYGVGMVGGVVLGAALCAWWRRDIRWEACDDARELGRHMAGGFLMGAGGIFAIGCTIGQGVSAVSLLAVSAPLSVLSIVIGARLGLAYLLEGSAFAAFTGFGARFRNP